ncbi:MAG TPA: UvrD-helicase domain-containing protein [Trebonia sp.]|nr:UvrD-helicase domain-containing protein [Trebonia sp.]
MTVRRQPAEPTEEQQQARDAFVAGGDLAVVAGAGTGKTSTLMLMAAATHKRGLYLAFNRATADDARRRFGDNVECRTAHSLAFAAVGRAYRDRLNSSARIPSAQAARILGITRDLDIESARISQAHQARLVTGMVRRLCYSNDAEPMARHMEPVNGLSAQATDYVAGTLVRFAVSAWDDIRAPSGKLRFEHDHYMKMWALTRPVLPGEFILLDEAQDTNPVLEEIFLAQAAQRVCVGDPAQQIYAWRAARDVMTGFPAEHVQLTRSFRFGPVIAEVANRWLRHAESDMRLTGAGPAESRVAPTRSAEAVLCRGNADVMTEVLAFLESGVRVAVTGGGEALRKIAEAAQQLKAGRRTSHPELFLFPSWGAVQEYVENDSAAQDLRSLVHLVDAHGAETIIDAVRRLSPESGAQVTVSTAHKAKGREWASVRIGPGFGPPSVDDDGLQHRLGLEEARLIYVAVTRAKLTLDVAGLAWADDYEKAIALAGNDSAAGVALIDLPLTGQLRYGASPISRFLADHLPGTRRAVRDYLGRIGDLPRPVQPADVRYPAWAALGHAIDFRLRLSLGWPLGDSVAAGVAAVGSNGSLRGAPSRAGRDALHRCGLELLATVNAYLGDPGSLPDGYLARLCFVAAFYEDVYRTGEVRRYSMLAEGTPDTTFDGLVAAVPGYAVDDLGQQMTLAKTAFQEFLALPRQTVTCGPVFAGSADIGGADADFILGGLLLDCKATITPRKLGADEINQLAGYLLLDYDDEFGIRQVGLYLSRQGATITWDVASFLELLGAEEPLPELRSGLRTYLHACRSARR